MCVCGIYSCPVLHGPQEKGCMGPTEELPYAKMS